MKFLKYDLVQKAVFRNENAYIFCGIERFRGQAGGRLLSWKFKISGIFKIYLIFYDRSGASVFRLRTKWRLTGDLRDD